MPEKTDSDDLFKNLPEKMPERAPQALTDQLKAAFPDKYNSKQHSDQLLHLNSALENGDYPEAYVIIGELVSGQTAVSGHLTDSQREAIKAWTDFYDPNKS